MVTKPKTKNINSNNSEIWDQLYKSYEKGKPIGISYPTEALVIFVSNLRKGKDVVQYFLDAGEEHSVKTGFSGKALEMGFGSTANLKMLKEKGFDVYGVEVSKEAVKRGTEGGFKNLHLWNPKDDFPFESESFDVVVGLQCIYYNTNFAAFEKKLHKKMKPDAQFIFSFFSRKHSYMGYTDFVEPGLVRFNNSHPNKRLVGCTLLSPPDEDALRKLFPSFKDVRVFTTESNQTPLFESWWYVTGRK